MQSSWNQAHEAFLSALVALRPYRHPLKEMILPEHGTRLGGLEQILPSSDDDDHEKKRFEERHRREKALFELRSVALPLMESSLNTMRTIIPIRTLKEYESQLELCRTVAKGADLETPVETLLLYHALVSIFPFSTL